MGQGHLRHVSWITGDFTRPVAEAGAKTVRHVVAPIAVHTVAHAAHHLQQCHVREWAALVSAGEEIGIAFDAG